MLVSGSVSSQTQSIFNTQGIGDANKPWLWLFQHSQGIRDAITIQYSTMLWKVLALALRWGPILVQVIGYTINPSALSIVWMTVLLKDWAGWGWCRTWCCYFGHPTWYCCCCCYWWRSIWCCLLTPHNHHGQNLTRCSCCNSCSLCSRLWVLLVSYSKQQSLSVFRILERHHGDNDLDRGRFHIVDVHKGLWKQTNKPTLDCNWSIISNWSKYR